MCSILQAGIKPSEYTIYRKQQHTADGKVFIRNTWSFRLAGVRAKFRSIQCEHTTHRRTAAHRMGERLVVHCLVCGG